MTQVLTSWWHQYTATAPNGLEITLTLGPTQMRPDSAERCRFPLQNGKGRGPECTYIKSFDYNPE